ncbi:peptidyl-prolyl cis-trans isomerase [Synechococcus sp. KORDI-52]|uniref:peptidylprolyl isomerase n=1 Tax=Synechococcus sp. KORDI-52 TaxID=585425 RepID=UPI0004E06FA3|nr:peptidylprolyl isomerase [Synechococcus sp. KORDI-52]AII48754.1 peptidyl-prolyl cis-trans isomerase [Synechococcus sp. KORDI-52]
MRQFRSWLLLLVVPLLVSCSPSPRASVVTGCADAQAACLQGLATVIVQTSQGEFTIEVNGDAAPLTSGNFVDLVQRGIYDGTMFHRVVREPVPFVVQGGDPQSSDRSVPLGQLGTGNFVDPTNGQARMIPLEIKFRSEQQPRYSRVITNPAELDDLVLRHDRGAVAMARSPSPDSASAQFYVALRPLPELDGRYAVFGRVVNGMEVVDAIQQGDRIIKAEVKQ